MRKKSYHMLAGILRNVPITPRLENVKHRTKCFVTRNGILSGDDKKRLGFLEYS
jgi:hypothetical protein